MNHAERITLKKLQVAEFASEETLCFAADVYFDGKKVGTAHNDGHGGMTFVNIKDESIGKIINGLIAKMPREKTEFKDEKDPTGFFHFVPTIDSMVDGIAHAMHNDKTLRAAFKRAMKKVAFVMTENGKANICTSIMALPQDAAMREKTIAAYAKHYPSAIILNRLDEPAALELYKQTMEAA